MKIKLLVIISFSTSLVMAEVPKAPPVALGTPDEVKTNADDGVKPAASVALEPAEA
jgi:hypothetical protein